MNTAGPKHREISRQLLAEIGVGKFGPTGRLPSEAQLVKRFGVSRPTVSRALRDLQDEGLIERRAGSGTYVKRPGQPSTSARQLGLLVPERGSTEIFEQICGEISRLARAQDYALLYGGSALPTQETDMDHRHALAMAQLYIEQRVRGVIFAPFEAARPEDRVNEQLTDSLNKAGIPVVLLDRDLTPFPSRSGFDLVGVDNFAGGYMAAEHVLKLGGRRVAFLRRPSSAPTIEARIAGAREALLRAGAGTSEDWIKVGDPESVAFVQADFVGRSWDAVLCANDLAAAQLLRSLERCGVPVPQGIRIVGFDDTPYASIVHVPLTTIHQPTREIALAAFRALTTRMADPTLPICTTLMPPRLVIRESCGAYDAAPR